jgi:pimeloyl-ACP methyl ester carboxylesterase
MVLPHLVLLPGDLFGPFISSAPRGYSLLPLRLPSDGSQTYETLARWVLSRLLPFPVVLLAESFSGQLGVRVAHQAQNVIALVLCATFIAPPLPRVLAKLAPIALRVSPPVELLRFMMTGGDHDAAIALQAAIRASAPAVVVARAAEALSADSSEFLAELRKPVLCLRSLKDRLVPWTSAERLRSLNPAVRIVDVESPHLLLQTRPAAAWRFIAQFVNGLEVQ